MPAHKKDPSLVARRNKPPAKTVLKQRKGVKVPALPTTTRWYPQVRDWWKRAWCSPMAGQWDESDRDSMFLAARLRQQFWDPETSASSRNQTSAQIRAIDDSLGLTPLSRKKLGWEIEDPNAGSESPPPTPRKRAPAKKAVAEADPRMRRLHAVS